MKRQIELSVLWVLLVLGFLAHTLADVMPAFWGESIVAMPTSTHLRELIALMMGICYTLPVLAIFLALWGKHKAWRVIHAILACLFALFCLLHMLEWLDEFNPVQLTIMPLMAIVGIILAVKSIKYVRENQCVDGEGDDNDEEEDENVGDEEEESEEEVSEEKGEEVSEKEEKETE
jgi:hypothetical protein